MINNLSPSNLIPVAPLDSPQPTAIQQIKGKDTKHRASPKLGIEIWDFVHWQVGLVDVNVLTTKSENH
jgi:hypothetical protein